MPHSTPVERKTILLQTPPGSPLQKHLLPEFARDPDVLFSLRSPAGLPAIDWTVVNAEGHDLLYAACERGLWDLAEYLQRETPLKSPPAAVWLAGYYRSLAYAHLTQAEQESLASFGAPALVETLTAIRALTPPCYRESPIAEPCRLLSDFLRQKTPFTAAAFSAPLPSPPRPFASVEELTTRFHQLREEIPHQYANNYCFERGDYIAHRLRAEGIDVEEKLFFPADHADQLKPIHYPAIQWQSHLVPLVQGPDGQQWVFDISLEKPLPLSEWTATIPPSLGGPLAPPLSRPTPPYEHTLERLRTIYLMEKIHGLVTDANQRAWDGSSFSTVQDEHPLG